MEQSNVKPDGSYVIDGLSNKPVYLMVTNWRTDEQGGGYPAIYAPSTFFRGEAKFITFDQSHSVDGVDVTLRKTGGLTLEGTVRNEKGEPIPEAFVVVHHCDMLFDRVTAYSDAKGHYEIRGLGDGEVQVHVDAVHRGFARTRTLLTLDRETAKMQRDIVLHRGASISGKLVDQDGKPWQAGGSHGQAFVTQNAEQRRVDRSWSGLPNKHAIRSAIEHQAVFYIPGEGDYDRSQMAFPTKSTFCFQSVSPGHTHIQFSPQEEGQGVIKIFHNGRDILKSGIDTKPGDEVKDVTIVIGKK